MNRQHGADAASRSEAQITVLFMDLFHQHEAIGKLVQKIPIGVCGDERLSHNHNRAGEIIQYGLQRFELLARQNALKTLLLTFNDRGQVDDVWFFDHKIVAGDNSCDPACQAGAQSFWFMAA